MRVPVVPIPPAVEDCPQAAEVLVSDSDGAFSLRSSCSSSSVNFSSQACSDNGFVKVLRLVHQRENENFRAVKCTAHANVLCL